MRKEFEDVYYDAEKYNWWFKARQNFVYRYLKKNKLSHSKAILDIGCGGGYLIQYLNGKGYVNTHGIDNSAAAIDHCCQRGLKDIKLADANQPINLPDESIDLIIASDVLEHLAEPGRALSEWKRVLKSDGMMIIFVPAYRFLWSYHDELNKHKTRYTKSNLKKIISRVQMQTTMASYWNFFLFVPYVLIVLVRKILKPSEMTINNRRLNKFLNSLLEQILNLENLMILNRISLPFGVSLVINAKKSS
jgi:SAM-dependent methyltransferase